jgi:hypothetical protein
MPEKYFGRSGREKRFSLDIPFDRTSGPDMKPMSTAPKAMPAAQLLLVIAA